MKKYKYYMEEGSEESCWGLDYFIDRINDGEKEIILKGCVIAYGGDGMFCSQEGEMIETGEGYCGKSCKQYSPRNGESGRCRFLKNYYDEDGSKFSLTKSGLVDKSKIAIILKEQTHEK